MENTRGPARSFYLAKSCPSCPSSALAAALLYSMGIGAARGAGRWGGGEGGWEGWEAAENIPFVYAAAVLPAATAPLHRAMQ